MTTSNLATPIPYRPLLAVLAGVFLLRVAVQFLLQFVKPAGMPVFDAWHSATMPYGVLLSGQLVVLAVMGWAIVALPLRTPRPAIGRLVQMFGWLYVAVMIARLIVGAGDFSALPWFDMAMPTVFHFGVAAFVLVAGSAIKGDWVGLSPAQYATRRAPAWARFAAYPALMCGGYALFTWLVAGGTPVLFASYVSVATASLGILLHETFAPARHDWRPTTQDIVRDGVFLSCVQVALPAMMKAGALAVIVGLANSGLAPLAGLWPNEWPVLAQVGVMVIVAEFFRYWLHRGLHTFGPLWRLHAVHHASDKLYTVNVGRFHPLDKMLQFLGDTLPFLVLGVGGEVFAAYFVLYAVNGFYQHSNADVRLGPLNWVIAGPELHRWHHSKTLHEAQSNYGNNLIIWDVVFGTRFLPKGRTLGSVGIDNAHWPSGFLAQMVAPFTTSPNDDRPPSASEAARKETLP